MYAIFDWHRYTTLLFSLGVPLRTEYVCLYYCLPVYPAFRCHWFKLHIGLNYTYSKILNALKIKGRCKHIILLIMKIFLLIFLVIMKNCITLSLSIPLKSDGFDGLTSDFFINASTLFYVYLSHLFTTMLY